MVEFYADDIIRRSKKLTGDEDPKVKFMSADDYSSHSPQKDRKENVKKKLEYLKEIALNPKLSSKDQMYATIDFAMQKANFEIVHSSSRNQYFHHLANPFLINERAHISTEVINVYDEQLAKVINPVEYEIAKKSKYGNCDQFSTKVLNAFQEVNYDKGGYGEYASMHLKTNQKT